MALDWLIVGGGIHGVHMAVRLLGEAGAAPDRLRIVDPAGRLLERWRVRAERVGMTRLRSPAVHHLDRAPHSLAKFGRTRRRRKGGRFTGSYARPTLEHFNAHADGVVDAFGLARLHVRARAVTCAVGRESVQVGLSTGERMTTRNVILAVGAAERPPRPEWAPARHPRVQHVFDPTFDGWPSPGEAVAVIGGGTSAAHVALRLRREGHDVHLVSRHPLREHRFDTDPGWLGSRLVTEFGSEPDLGRRRSWITRARNSGSVHPAVRLPLCGAIARDEVLWREGAVESLEERPDGLVLRLDTEEELHADRVLLATGFGSERPGGAMVDALIASASLPCAPCGYPVLDSALRWHPRVRVSGPLAELELGPVARNIAGARRAADRLVRA